MSKKISDLVYKLVKPLVLENNIELVDVEFVKEGANYYLRLFIDREGGVRLSDCEKISEQVSELLDEVDPIPHAYFLEVSSPGIERTLKREKDFIRYQGHLVNVSTYVPIDGKKRWQGKLGIYNQSVLKLILEDQTELNIPWEKVSQVKLEVHI